MTPEIQKDNARGRAWGGLTAILMLFALILKAFGVADWPHLIAFLIITSGGLAALIFRKNKGADGPGEK